MIFNYLKCNVLLLSVVLLAACNREPIAPPLQPAPPVVLPFLKGVDASFVPTIEQSGAVYRDSNGVEADFFALCKARGINSIRIRLWHSPADGHSGLAEVVALAQRVKQAGLLVWLDFHYSDTWADPGAQQKPAAWQSLTAPQLHDSVYAYTAHALNRLKEANAEPSVVQVGNEINGGILWNTGRWDSDTLYSLLAEGVRAVRTVTPQAKVMMHYAGITGADYFFRNLKQQKISFDLAGLSYYPWWHGSDLAVVETALHRLSDSLSQPIVIAETAYPFTLQWNDYTNNVVGSSSQTLPNLPASQANQAVFLAEIKRIVRGLPQQRGGGVCYWGGEWTAFRGAQATNGSSWENLALFDFQSRPTLALRALGD